MEKTRRPFSIKKTSQWEASFNVIILFFRQDILKKNLQSDNFNVIAYYMIEKETVFNENI